jgi:LmbE family N-acetylglucosaminyl deacetylase
VLGLSLNGREPLRFLCLGAHCDDIEIGCGGTILTLANSGHKIEVLWVVFTSDPIRKNEALISAESFLKGTRSSVAIHDFRDGFLPYLGGEVKDCFERLREEFQPDVILTHYRNDLHQDHRLISELTWNTYRNHLVLEYEVPKYDGDFGSPNLFVPLDQAICRRKVDLVLDAFSSQADRPWFSRELFMSVLRLRGMEANSRSGYAEGFYSRKANLNLEME